MGYRSSWFEYIHSNSHSHMWVHAFFWSGWFFWEAHSHSTPFIRHNFQLYPHCTHLPRSIHLFFLPSVIRGLVTVLFFSSFFTSLTVFSLSDSYTDGLTFALCFWSASFFHLCHPFSLLLYVCVWGGVLRAVNDQVHRLFHLACHTVRYIPFTLLFVLDETGYQLFQA